MAYRGLIAPFHRCRHRVSFLAPRAAAAPLSILNHGLRLTAVRLLIIPGSILVRRASKIMRSRPMRHEFGHKCLPGKHLLEWYELIILYRHCPENHPCSCSMHVDRDGKTVASGPTAGPTTELVCGRVSLLQRYRLSIPSWNP